MKLEIGTYIEVNQENTTENGTYKSKVIDFEEDNIMIDYPTHMKTGKTAFFLDGTQLLVSFTDKLKNTYCFKAEVNGRMIKGIPMLRVSFPGDDQLIRVQRREFVRTQVSLDVAAKSVGEFKPFIAEDISAGGIALNLLNDESFFEDSILSLIIVLPFIDKEPEYIRTKGRIIRIIEKGGRRVASIQFNETGVRDRQRIVRFCFEQELKMRNG